MPSTIYAVLIADVMESRARADLRSLLGKKLAAISRRHLSRKLIQLPYSVTGGEAFQTAREAIESIKTGNLFKFEVLTAFVSRYGHFNKTINLIYGLHDTLVLKITERQWETIQEFLDSPTLELTAKRLKLDDSTVSRNLKRGYYWQLTETVQAAGSLIKRTFC